MNESFRGLLKQLQSNLLSEREDAVHEFERLGASAAGAVPDLVKLLEGQLAGKRRGNRSDTYFALRAIGPVGLCPVLNALAESSNRDLAEPVLDLILTYGTEAAPAASCLRDLLGPRIPEEIRYKVLDIYCAIGPPASVALDEIMAELVLARRMLYQISINALGEIGMPAFERLIELSHSDEDDLQAKAAAALGPFGLKALPRLCELLEADDGGTRIQAVKSLVHSGKAAVEPLLRRFNEEKFEPVKIEICEVLGQIGRDASPAQEQVFAFMQEAESHLNGLERSSLLEALGKIGTPDFVLPKVEQMLEDYVAREEDECEKEGDDVHEAVSAAAAVLGNFPKEAERVVPFLLRLVKERPDRISQGIEQAAAGMGLKGLPVVEAILTSPDTYYSVELARAFADISPASFDLLERALHTKDRQQRALYVLKDLASLLQNEVSYARRTYPPEWYSELKARVYPFCLSLLDLKGANEWEAKVRIEAVEAFNDDDAVGSMLRIWLAHPKLREDVRLFLLDRAKISVPLLLDVLEQREDLRLDIVKFFAAIGPHAEPALPKLRVLAREGSEALAKAAKKAVREILHPR